MTTSMTQSSTRLRLLVAVCCISLCATPALADDTETIKTLTQAWMDQAADIETYFSFITEDFAWIGDRDDGGIRGREELRAFLEPFFEMTVFSVARWATDDLIFSGNGNQAVHIFTGEVVLEDKASGDRTAIDRTYVDFWSKQPDGKWLCTRHTFVVLGVREL